MRISFVYKYICEIIIVITAIFFFANKDLKIPYDKVITAEGLGYYVYLPATFIYHDYTFSFFNDVYTKYYGPSDKLPTKNFINEFNGFKVDQYFPGVSLLWLPFFLGALCIAHILHWPIDGFSDVFQYSIGLAGLFYTWLGLKFLKRVLEQFSYSRSTILFTLLAIIFGTNLLYYVICYPSHTHCYLFFLIAAFSYYSIALFDDKYLNKKSALVGVIITLALIVTIRPQDIIIILLLPFFGLTIPKFKTLFTTYFFSPRVILALLAGILIIARVCYYWYLQTGQVFLNPYTGRDHYVFTNPHFFDILFSYRKGWITYCPLIFVGLSGIFFIKNNFQRLYLFVFWLVLVYITSCWWCWTFSPSSFGQRVFVDYYVLIGISLGALFEFFIQKKKAFVPGAILVFAIPLCLLQTHQYKSGIIPGEFATKETFWNNFLQINSLAQYPIPASAIINRFDTILDFEKDTNDYKISNLQAYSGKHSTFVSKSNPYSRGGFVKIPAFMKPGDYSHIRASAMISSSKNASSEVMVLDFPKMGKSIAWKGFEVSPYVFNSKWTHFETGLNLPEGVNAGDSLNFYFWQPEGNDTTYIDNMKLEFIEIDHSYDLKGGTK